MNKNDAATLSDTTTLSFAEIESITKQGSNSFYYLDFNKLKNNYRRLQAAFSHEYQNTQLAYSFKTNYAPAICKTLKQEGCWAEVVSEMEYDIAIKKVGYAAEKVVVNGPVHEPEFIRRTLLDGAWLNIDSWYLLDHVAQLCHDYSEREFQIGIRLTYPIEEGGFSRFGIESSDENIQKLSKWQDSVPNCRIAGFHSHFSNSSRSLTSFHSRVLGLLSAIDKFFIDKKPEFINIGGGLFGEMPESLARQHGENLPDFEAYAQTIASKIKEKYPAAQVPILFLEPGTALVANTMVFICKVYEMKQVDGKTIALVNASKHNVKHKWQDKSLPIDIVRQNPLDADSEHEGCFDIVGNTCIENDVMCQDVPGSISVGDYVIFHYMGGYSNVLKQPFIHPCQPIYGYDGLNLTLIKRAGKMEDVLQTYA